MEGKPRFNSRKALWLKKRQEEQTIKEIIACQPSALKAIRLDLLLLHIRKMEEKKQIQKKTNENKYVENISDDELNNKVNLLPCEVRKSIHNNLSGNIVSDVNFPNNNISDKNLLNENQKVHSKPISENISSDELQKEELQEEKLFDNSISKEDILNKECEDD